MNNKNRRGFSYVELLISMAIMGIILYIIIDLSGFSLRVQKESTKKFEIQSDVTYSGNTLSETVRDATAIFLLNENKFNPSLATESNINSTMGIKNLKMTPGWNYIALNNEKTKIYNFIWDDTLKNHVPFELTLPDKGNKVNPVEYAITFSHRQDEIQKQIDKYKHKASLTPSEKDELKKLNRQLENSRSSIDFAIEGKVQNDTYGIGAGQKELNEYKVDSTVYAQNTRQIMDISDGREVTAIAYRTTDLITQSTRLEKPAIALVLDFSGSMNGGLDGYAVPPAEAHRKRIELLKVEYKKIIESLNAQGDFDLYIIPFSTRAFDKALFVDQGPSNIQAVKDQLPFKIVKGDTSSDPYLNALNYLSNFKVYGWTNYGDAVRVGIEYLRTSGKANTYLLVLSDGEPTALNVTNGYWEDSGPGDSVGTYDKNGAGLTIEDCTQYIEYILNYQNRQAPSYKPKLVYLVGFSSVAADNSRLKQIEQYFEGSMKMNPDLVKVIEAKDQYQLSNAFNGFVADINADLWYFDGP